MTIEEQFKNTNTEEFAEKLLNFFAGFHNGEIEELCNDDCCHNNKCIACITNWLKTNSKFENKYY